MYPEILLLQIKLFSLKLIQSANDGFAQGELVIIPINKGGSGCSRLPLFERRQTRHKTLGGSV